MIIVDELQRWPHGKGVFRGRESCHLMVDDGDLDALHAFASKLGLRRSWYQPVSSPHYDLTPNKREMALRLGAVFVPWREQAKRRIEERRARGVAARWGW
jgi:hypothetical protein